MKILIVDDEAPARSRLRTLIAGLGGYQVVGEAGNGADALSAFDALRPDVVLLDIHMPGMNGLETASHMSLDAEPPAVVFVTAHGEHALAAFEAEAVDYLLKPVRRERLAVALNKATRLNRAQLEALTRTETGSDPDSRDQLLCRRRSGIELIPVDSVRFFQADHKYVTVNHTDGEDLIEDSLKRLECEFGDRFVRIHRNALVARSFIGGLEKSDGGYRLRVRDADVSLEVSRRHVGELLSLLRRLGE